MKILFLGDSITEGVGASVYENCYVEQVRQTLGCEVINYGVGGTRIARQKKSSCPTRWDYDFQLRMQIMEKDADLVFVFGGTNDYGHGDAEIGTFGDTDPYTFYGGLKNLIEYLIGKYGKEKLCFLLPLHRGDENDPRSKGSKAKNGLPLSGYVDIIRKTVEFYGLDYLDLYNDGIPCPQACAADEYTSDGLHPNDKGHKLIAEKVCEYIRNKQ